MAQACEGWYLGRHSEHDTVAPLLVSYLILQSLREQAKVQGGVLARAQQSAAVR
jgi:hypothetical protein